MKKFRVLIDLDRLKDVNNGLGQVALNLAREIAGLQLPDIEFTLLVPKDFVGKFGHLVQYEVLSNKRRWLPFLCRKYDLWYTIHQDSWYFPSRFSTPYVLTINDLNYANEKKGIHLWYRSKRLQLKIQRARTIIGISQSTVGDIRKHFDVLKKDVRVIYCGVEVKTFENVAKPGFVPTGKFLFAVGVVQPKKNYKVLPPFIGLLPENYSLIIAGNKSGSYAEELMHDITDLNLSDRIILPGIISDEDRFWCYQNCHAVVFPSLLEGMGFPPIEAMRFGKPVFASTSTSIPEVCGPYAYYWQNFGPDYMARVFTENIGQFYASPSKASEVVQHSLKYTWTANVEQLVALFRQILAPK